MSIKTLRKRIALVAVSTLGAGLMTVVVAPSAHATPGLTVAANGGTSITSRGIISGTTGSNLTGTSNTFTLAANGIMRITSAGGETGGFKVSGGTITECTSGTATVAGGGTIAISSGGTVCTNTGGTTQTFFAVVPTAAGTMTITQDTTATSGTASVRLTVTVVATSTIGALSAANSFAAVTSADAAAEVTTMTDTASALRVANGSQGYIGYTLHDGNDIAMPTTTVVSCSATGGAVCSFTSGTFLGTTASDTYPSADYDTIYVAQGTANTAIATTVTISVNGTPWISKTLSLLGPLAKLEIGTSDSLTGGIYGKVSTSDGYVGVKATDSLGRLLTSQSFSFTGASYNNSVTAFSASTTGSSTSLNTDVAFTCSSTTGSNDIQVTATNALNATITSNAFKVYCVGGAYSYTAALDKAVYVPGDIATLTITAKDSKGNPAADSSTLGSTAKAVGIAGSNMTAVTAPSNVDTFTAGVKKYTFVVGSTEGAYQMSVSLPLIDVATTVPYSIKSSTATVSNTEVLAAIVKLIASINKQIRALQKSLRR
jgi:hypothetical protein